MFNMFNSLTWNLKVRKNIRPSRKKREKTAYSKGRRANGK